MPANLLGLLLMLFATVGTATPLWVIVLQAFCYGAFMSLQYTSMNTLVYANIPDDRASNASSIASTMQQMSISFGVAAAGLTTALFIPDGSSSNSSEMISWPPRGISCPWRIYRLVNGYFPQIEKRGRRERDPAKGSSPRVMVIRRAGRRPDATTRPRRSSDELRSGSVCGHCLDAIFRSGLTRGAHAGRYYSHPRSPNAERSTPGGAYHPAEP